MAMTDVYTGANGGLFFVPGDGTEGEDAKVIIDLKAFELFQVGRVTGVELHIDTDLEEFHEIGLRHASSLHPGNIHIRGTIERAYVNGALLYMLLGRGASPNNIKEPYVQPALAMNVVLNDPANPDIRSVIDIYGVKLQNWALNIPEDDFVMENVTFKALRLNARDEEKKEIRTPAFPEASS